jgi:acyl-CoA reductase-like NAD-dependent aldehyde dehydrogenase
MQTYNMIIDGKTVSSVNDFEVINPATGATFAKCALGDESTVDLAVAAAQRAFVTWRDVSDEEKVSKVNALASILEQNMPELMELVTKESGKPMGGLNDIGSGMEVGGSIAWTQYTGSLSLSVDSVQDDDLASIEVHRKPLGVVASITPWNWPLMIAIWHVIPAIRAGNTVLIKPSPLTPVATMRFVELANTVLPPGVLNVITGDGPVGNVISNHPGINKIVFTGSTQTGKKIMSAASGNLKRLTLELGGNDAGILLADVDVKAIAPKLFAACFHNNGQTCACLKRLYVHESIYDEVCSEMAAIAKSVVVGDGLEEGTQLGPVQNKMQLTKVKELIDDAIQQGAKILAGGNNLGGDGYFYPPTIVSDISDGVRLVDEEQFGPVLPIIKYADINEVLTRSNNNECGLGGSVWSKDISKAKAIAAKMETGSVWINDHGAIQPNAPFGGVKQSGIGVEFGQYGLEEYVSLQTIKVCKA